MKTKKRMGRPALSPDGRRSAYLRVSLRQKEAKKCAKLAKLDGKTFSTWARGILLAAVSSEI